MNGWSLLSAASLAAAVALGQRVPFGAATAAAFGTVTPRPATAGNPRFSSADRPDAVSISARRGAAACTVVAVLMVAPGFFGWVLAGFAAYGLDLWLSRQSSRHDRGRARTIGRQLPLCLELTAAALASGATTAAAVVLAADGCGAPIAGPLREVAASLSLGAAPDEAWRPALQEPALRQFGRLALRSTASGAAMAGACRELSRHEREARVVEAQVAVKRAGVLTVLPLALCFLPSFVLVGVVPMVVGLLRSLSL